MTGRIFTADHHVYDLPAPLSWTVTHTASVPCDSYSITVVFDQDMAQVLRLAAGFAAIEQGQTVLRGIVDEYSIDMEGNGLTATISGRGYAARLLDNESRPVTYQDVTLEEIIRCHVTPYGISCQQIADVRATGGYTVASGCSQWKALADFCRVYGGFTPSFARDGKLIAAPAPTGKRLLVGQEDPILSCTLREDHYGVLTEVLVIDKKQNAAYSVYNQDMIAKGGQCRKVIYTPGSSTWAAMRYTGEYQIAQSRQEEKLITLTLPGSFLAFPGDQVSLMLERMGIQGEFIVAEAENNFSQTRGATAALTLKEKT